MYGESGIPKEAQGGESPLQPTSALFHRRGGEGPSDEENSGLKRFRTRSDPPRGHTPAYPHSKGALRPKEASNSQSLRGSNPPAIRIIPLPQPGRASTDNRGSSVSRCTPARRPLVWGSARAPRSGPGSVCPQAHGPPTTPNHKGLVKRSFWSSSVVGGLSGLWPLEGLGSWVTSRGVPPTPNLRRSWGSRDVWA
jgi:hypothetical protein